MIEIWFMLWLVWGTGTQLGASPQLIVPTRESCEELGKIGLGKIKVDPERPKDMTNPRIVCVPTEVTITAPEPL
jgi:hypothetical protein